jgi:hypothetical protein
LPGPWVRHGRSRGEIEAHQPDFCATGNNLSLALHEAPAHDDWRPRAIAPAPGAVSADDQGTDFARLEEARHEALRALEMAKDQLPNRGINVVQCIEFDIAAPAGLLGEPIRVHSQCDDNACCGPVGVD